MERQKARITMSNEIDRIVSLLKEINPPELQSQKDRLKSEISLMDGYGILGDLLSHYDSVYKNPSIKGDVNIPNSMLAYCLGITSKKPDGEFKLEKRRTYGRDGWPDIDMDFCYERRHEIVEYLINKYGRDKVGNIGTVQTLKTKSTLRRVIRAIDPEGSVAQGDPSRNFQFQNEILNTLPKSGIMKRADGTIIENVQQAYDEFSEFRRYMDKYPEVFEMAKQLEGGISAYGIHAAGICVSPIPLAEICPLHVTKGIENEESEKFDESSEKMVGTQFSMSDVESVGLIKMDVLGLSTKTAIHLAKELIKQNHGIDVDTSNIPLDDKLTIKLLKSGNTDGCFQLEEPGMKQTIQQIDIDSFSGLMIAIAMYRPGPKDYIPELANRKKGTKKIDYLHPILEKITKQTYGILVYQEEVMQAFMELADLTPSEGYTFMKGCAKKKKKLIMEAKDKFTKGALRNNIPDKIVNKIWSDMEKFGGYAFNAAHSCAYAYESWKTAYLKSHFPTEFITARLTVETRRRKFDYVEKCERDATQHFGIKILPVDINRSKLSYTILGEKEILRPLILKDVGDKAAEEIIKHQPYNDGDSVFQSFAFKVGPIVNTKVVEALCDAKLFGDVKKSKILKDFEIIKDDRKKSIGRPIGDIFGKKKKF